MAAGAAAGAWVLVLSLWGEPLPSHQSSPQKALHPPPHICPELFLEPGHCFSSSLTHLVLVLLALPFPPTPPPLYCLPGAVGGDRNITARIGKPLVLNCRGAPKKPPQQLEWKLNTGRTEAWKVLSPQGGSWDSVARVLPNGSLLLPAVGVQDEGTFRCRATSRKGKETRSAYQVRVYQTPEKPEIINPASELMAGVPNKVGTCVSEGGYPAGTLNWHSNGKPLIPDGKGTSVQEETRRHPKTGLFTLQSELTVIPAQGGAPHPTFSCSFRPGLPRRRALHTAPIQLTVWEPVPPEVQVMVQPEDGKVVLGGTLTLTCETPAQSSLQIHWIKDGIPLHIPPTPVLLFHKVKLEDQGTYSCVATHPSHEPQESPAVHVIIEADKPIAGSVEGQGLGTVALALGILGGLGIAALLIGAIMWRRQRHRREERKAPENQEEEEERAELNQSEEPEAAESSATGP
ncbi:advanced glycosylation end product-specific receptor isoform X1 [Ailuropoda melanoleuca]|uniref:advanced glycosylation end product-specific receptor isoform X1 n=1 Tax=Ailuropoda melanoleuca TaxID=9646 RepID=UPI00059B1AAD|nr:advanced glycosylation end product-specific receptor isoform X1 [Ailuropoda melanoleuca]